MSRHTVTCAEADGIECGFAVVVYYCRTYVKAVRGGGSEERGRVLWDATSRGLCLWSLEGVLSPLSR